MWLCPQLTLWQRFGDHGARIPIGQGRGWVVDAGAEQVPVVERRTLWIRGISRYRKSVRQGCARCDINLQQVVTSCSFHRYDSSPLRSNYLQLWHQKSKLPFVHQYLPRDSFNSLRPRLNRHSFADDIFKWIFLNVNEWILPRISLKFVPKVRINNIPALVQIMAWRRPGDKPLSEPMMVSLLTHICVTPPQWVNASYK